MRVFGGRVTNWQFFRQQWDDYELGKTSSLKALDVYFKQTNEVYEGFLFNSATQSSNSLQTASASLCINTYLTSNIHINELVTSCYGALAALKLHDLALFCVKKQLVGSLILSKLDYASTVFYPLPLCQLKRLQRVQNVRDMS